MIELRRRTPAERKAYLDGYAAGVRTAAEVLAATAQQTSDAANKLKAEVDVLRALAADLS